MNLPGLWNFILISVFTVGVVAEEHNSSVMAASSEFSAIMAATPKATMAFPKH